jgi:hypothetical protein
MQRGCRTHRARIQICANYRLTIDFCPGGMTHLSGAYQVAHRVQSNAGQHTQCSLQW